MFVFKKYWEIPNDSYNLTEPLWKIQKRQKRTCQCYSTQERVGCRYWKHTVRPTQRRASHCPWDDPDPRSSTLRWLPLALAVCLSPSGQSPHWLRWCHPPDSPQLWLTMLRPASKTLYLASSVIYYTLSFWKVVRSVSSADRPATWCPIISFSFFLSPSQLRGFVGVWLSCVCDARMNVKILWQVHYTLN